MHNRIVVTGIGMVTPLGLDVKSSWNHLIESQSGICKIPFSFFDTSKVKCHIAGLVGQKRDEKTTWVPGPS